MVGGGTGGVAAALAALRLGRRVILSEESDWIGGQFTAQAVPPDEHPWIERTGATRSYMQFAQNVRDYYRRHYPLTDQARGIAHFNPGKGMVSRLCHEPRVALAILEAMLAPWRGSGQLEIWHHHVPVSAESDGDRIRAVTLRNLASGDETTLSADWVLDATEHGDLLELADVEHVVGAESQAQTGELHALPADPDPLDQQAVTWCFAMDWLPGENHVIDRPAGYDIWRGYQADFWPGPQLGWRYPDPVTLEPVQRPLFASGAQADFWRYRRILCRDYYSPGAFRSDVTLVNWPQNDYWLGPLVGVPLAEIEANLRAARQLSLSTLHWMQTEAPRHDGGQGYPGLRLRPDIVGTCDGLAKRVYVRESRRIRAEFTVLEQHLGVEQRGGLVGAEPFPDSVGVGSYRIDLHPGTSGRNYVDVSCYLFQIPLGALIPQRVENLLPACKNAGVTHVTNGCFRLHPVEWNVGEAAGALAAWCQTQRLQPRQVRGDAELLNDFQTLLRDKFGFVLEWSEYARVTPR
ncbi:MAG: FAD-dependent oxidoreductase [Anaerolineaceae bacterium]|nr:FAD-dependent oxidoreductase [Anaerolineaceae bacterium]MDE0329021.1 FAD-dependent oxidoreductase [Anaerolineaceae bacterium]